MLATWWAKTDQGYMTGDYISATIACNRAVTVVPVATALTGQTFHQYMEGVSIAVTGGSIASGTLQAASTTPHAACATGSS